METFGKKLKRLREEAGLTGAELARLVKTSKKQVSFWENDKAMPSKIKLKALAEALNVSVDELVEDGEPDGKCKRIPVYGYAHCGSLNLAESHVDGYVSACDMPHTEQHFALEAHGSSMEPFIMAGDMLVFRRVDGVRLDVKGERPVSHDRLSLYDGKIVAVMVDGDTSVKRWRIVRSGDDWSLELHPINIQSAKIVLSADQQLELQGVLVELRRKC